MIQRPYVDGERTSVLCLVGSVDEAVRRMS